MKLEFNLYKAKENSYLMNLMSKKANNNMVNEFIVIGKCGDRVKALPLNENGLRLIGGLKIDEFALRINKTDLEPLSSTGIGIDSIELDIPKEYLTMDIIEEIEKINF